MAPPTPTIHVSELEGKVNVLSNGKPRKPPVGLSECPLKELVQYKCNISKPKQKGARPDIVCEPVVRLYRQCANGLHVETTAWERWRTKEEGSVGV